MGDDRTQQLIADLAACDAARDAALRQYIMPFTMRRQELLAELGQALAGFKIGTKIYSPTRKIAMTVTAFTAHLFNGTWHWSAHGNTTAGPATAHEGDHNKWRLVK